MTLNIKTINTEIVNNILAGGIDGTYSGKVFSASQEIQCNYTGAVLGVTQSISLLVGSNSATVCSVSQKVMTKQSSQSEYSITQMIISP